MSFLLKGTRKCILLRMKRVDGITGGACHSPIFVEGYSCALENII